MKQKKFWQKLIGSTLAILLIVPFSFINVKANTYNANYSLTQYNYYVEKNGTDWATTDIFVNFKAPASGTLTINISPTISSNYYSFNVISGGNLASSPTTSTSKLTIGVRSQQVIQVRVQSISTQSNAHATYTMSFSGTYEDGEALSLDNIDASLVTLNGKIDTTNNVLAQINTKLANLSIQDYTQILNTINTSIGSVQNAIEDLPDYTNTLNSINNYLGSIDVNISDIETICSGILSAINNIDTLIDTISWVTFSSSLQGYSSDLINFTKTEDYYGNGYILFNPSSTNNSIKNNMIMKIQIPVNSVGINDITKWRPVMVSNGGSVTALTDYVMYYQFNRLFATYYLDLSRIPNFGTYRFGIQMRADLSRYIYFNQQPAYCQYIGDNDIEYWKLRSTMQQWQFYNGNNATNQSISDQTSTNQSFESQSDQYHNLESTFQSNFDTAFNAVNPSDFTTALTQFAPAFAWFTNQLGALYDSSGNFKILFTLPLILGLAMFFLGRGGKVFDHPEHESDKHAYTFSKDTDGTIYPVRKNRSGNNVRNS